MKAPTKEEVNEFFIERLPNKAQALEEADTFFNYYMANGWTQGKGKPIKAWKYAVLNWIKRIDSFIPEGQKKVIAQKVQPLTNEQLSEITQIKHAYEKQKIK